MKKNVIKWLSRTAIALVMVLTIQISTNKFNMSNLSLSSLKNIALADWEDDDEWDWLWDDDDDSWNSLYIYEEKSRKCGETTIDGEQYNWYEFWCDSGTEQMFCEEVECMEP